MMQERSLRNHNNFRENLEFGQQGEIEVAKRLMKVFKGLEIKDFNNDKACDIVCEWNGKPMLVEVKEDERCKDTGNVVVEYKSWGKPSGIATSTSDIWVFKLHRDDGIHYLMFGIKTLRKIIEDRLYWNNRQMMHTDSNNWLYFFKYNTLLDKCDLELV